MTPFSKLEPLDVVKDNRAPYVISLWMPYLVNWNINALIYIVRKLEATS